MIGASAHQFMPDSALAFRAIGSDPISGAFASSPLSLAKLAAYWSTGEWGTAKRMRVIIGLEGAADAGVDALRFALEVDSTADFGSPQEVASLQLSDDDVRWFELSFDTDSLAYADPDAAYLRLTATGAGADVATIVTDDFIAPGSGFTITNAEPVEVIVLVGTNAVGSVTFSGAATADDEVVIDDGVNAPVTFTFGVGAGLVDPGAGAAASATNLAAAIEAAVTAGDLAVAVVDDLAGELTITLLAAFSGLGDAAITDPVDDGTVITVVDFTGGVEGISTEAMIELGGGTVATQRQEIADYINSEGAGSYTATVNSTTITVVNNDAEAGVSSGEATEDTDTGSHIAITDFAVSADVSFWAFVRND